MDEPFSALDAITWGDEMNLVRDEDVGGASPHRPVPDPIRSARPSIVLARSAEGPAAYLRDIRIPFARPRAAGDRRDRRVTPPCGYLRQIVARRPIERDLMERTSARS